MQNFLSDDVRVEILLSTYNGSKYLPEQLDSLLVQSYNNLIVTVRDDYSTDNTLEILTKYADDYPGKIRIMPSQSNLGSSLSFYQLLKHSSSDYVMFCDQDDVWYPDKVELTIRRMHEYESVDEKPLLTFTDLEVVDENCNHIPGTLMNRMRLDPDVICKKHINMIALNSVAGCTVLLNKLAILKLVEFGEFPKGIVHDHWCAVIIKIFGDVIYLNQPTIKYRQHQKNQVGDLKVSKEYLINRLSKINSTLQHDLFFIRKLNKYHKVRPISLILVKLILNIQRFFK